MTTELIIIGIFCIVDDQMRDIAKHEQAKLYPSELVTIGILFALKGGHFAAFYRWLKRDYDGLFGGLPDRTRLQRSLAAHQDWCDRLLVEPSVFTVGDSYPIELLFPIREGRTTAQIGKKGRDKGRWMIGFRLWWLLDTYGRVVEWYWLDLSHPDHDYNALTASFDEQTIALHDFGFRDAKGLPSNIKICKKGTWNERMVVETSFSMITVICNTKKFFHRVADYLWSHCAYLTAMFNVLSALFHQLHPDQSPFKMSIAEFSL